MCLLLSHVMGDLVKLLRSLRPPFDRFPISVTGEDVLWFVDGVLELSFCSGSSVCQAFIKPGVSATVCL